MKQLGVGAVLAMMLVGCSQQGTGPSYETGSSTGSRSATEEPIFAPERTPSRRPAESRESKLAFLQSIREADPRHQTIERALMNERNELGIILNRQVDMDDIPNLMRALLKQMAARFPGEDLTIIAYAPANPPLQIGTARLDARTREMSYTPATHNRI